MVGRRVELVFDPFDLTQVAQPVRPRPGAAGRAGPLASRPVVAAGRPTATGSGARVRLGVDGTEPLDGDVRVDLGGGQTGVPQQFLDRSDIIPVL